MRVLRVTCAVSVLVLGACGGQPDAQPRHPDGSPLMAVVGDPAGAGTRDLLAGRLAEARTGLEASLSENPDAIASLNDLAVTYSMDERFDAARQLLEDALARGAPRDQQLALVNLAELYAVEGYLTAAGAHLTAAQAIDPSRAEPAYALALLLDVRSDGAGSAAALRDAMAADPSGADRTSIVFLYPEERVHLEALVAEASGDPSAAARWQELARGRFPSLAQVAQRHLVVAGAP